MVRMDSAYELGRAAQSALVEQQLVGGAWMGISHASMKRRSRIIPTQPRTAATSSNI